jgi:hypothetical protein
VPNLPFQHGSLGSSWTHGGLMNGLHCFLGLIRNVRKLVLVVQMIHNFRRIRMLTVRIYIPIIENELSLDMILDDEIPLRFCTEDSPQPHDWSHYTESILSLSSVCLGFRLQLAFLFLFRHE